MPVRNNVTRLLEQRKVWYEPVEYDPAEFHSATEVAAMVGAPPGQVFKTIVALREERGKRPLLVIVPGDREVDLKRLAAGLGEKKVRVAPQREAEALTKLQVGGISALRSEEHTSELQSRQYLVCRLLLEKKNYRAPNIPFIPS